MTKRANWGLVAVVVSLALAGSLVLTRQSGTISPEYDLLASVQPDSASAAPQWDLVVQRATFQPGTNSGWHSHPGGAFVAVKSGSVTLYMGNNQSCTARTFKAGEGFFEPANKVLLARNEGSQPVEVYATFVEVPVGEDALVKSESNPGGADCPSVTASTTGIALSQLARATISNPPAIDDAEEEEETTLLPDLLPLPQGASGN